MSVKSTLRTLLLRLAQGVSSFLSEPASPRPLAAFRIGVAAVLLAQAFALAGGLLELYGVHGILQWSLYEDVLPAGVPSINGVVRALAPLGVGERAAVYAVFLSYVASLGCLLVGWRTRLAAAGACLTHLALNTTGTASIYGVDQFAQIALFYCVWAPVGAALSADRAAGRVSDAPSAAARLGLRVLQLHLSIIYLSSGIEKATGEQWWNGEAIWRSLMRPDLGQYDFSWLASAPWLATLICWGTLAVEIGYAFFVWPRRTRKLWALATLGLHGGIAVVMGLWSFSALMMVLTFSAFLVSAQPRPAEAHEALTLAQPEPGAA